MIIIELPPFPFCPSICPIFTSPHHSTPYFHSMKLSNPHRKPCTPRSTFHSCFKSFVPPCNKLFPLWLNSLWNRPLMAHYQAPSSVRKLHQSSSLYHTSCSSCLFFVVDLTFKSNTNEALPTSITNPIPYHPMQTWSKNNILKPPKKKNALSPTKYPMPSGFEPTIIIQALTQKEWRDSMNEELQALASNATWELVPCEPWQNIVSYK